MVIALVFRYCPRCESMQFHTVVTEGSTKQVKRCKSCKRKQILGPAGIRNARRAEYKRRKRKGISTENLTVPLLPLELVEDAVKPSMMAVPPAQQLHEKLCRLYPEATQGHPTCEQCLYFGPVCKLSWSFPYETDTLVQAWDPSWAACGRFLERERYASLKRRLR